MHGETLLLKWLVFLVVVAWLASNWSRHKGGAQEKSGGVGRRRRRNRRDNESAPNAAPPSERMLRCAHCDVHVPASSCVVRDGQSYCSPAHADAAQAGGTGRGHR